MNPKGIFYILAFASDLERSKKFYGETLGWRLDTDERNVAGFSFGASYLVLHADNRPANARRYAGGMQVEVLVDDAAAEHARLVSLGVEVSALRDQVWGERNFYFVDPDGYQWLCGQPISQEK